MDMKTLKRRLRRTCAKLPGWVRALEIDIGDVVFFGGVAMIGLGVGGRYGAVAAGAVLVLSVKPLFGFFKREK